MPSPLRLPSNGIPKVFSTPAEFNKAANLLAHGVGPVAIDTERANSFRCDDRAFLIQLHRRGVGTLLLAPEHHRAELHSALAPVLNPLEWVVHAALSDLPSLLALGLYPSSLIDTEKAAKIAGYTYTNLGQLTSDILDLELAKGHGRENWSITPLPKDWIIYAALDVEKLIELSEALVEILDQQGKLSWATEEFEFIRHGVTPNRDPRTGHVQPTPLPITHWRETKGIGALRTKKQLAIARELWLARNTISQHQDIAPSRILKNKELIAIAQLCATTPAATAQALHLKSLNKKAVYWSSIARKAIQKDAATWPDVPTPHKPPFPPSKYWQDHYPHVLNFYQKSRTLLEAKSREIHTPLDCIISMSVLKEVAWVCAEQYNTCHAEIVAGILAKHHARNWQIEFIINTLCFQGKIIFPYS